MTSSSPSDNRRSVAVIVLVVLGVIVTWRAVKWGDALEKNEPARATSQGPSDVDSAVDPPKKTTYQTEPEQRSREVQAFTREELGQIEVHLAAAKKHLEAITVANTKYEEQATVDGRKATVAYLPELTAEQLAPIYAMLSDAGREFAPRSSAAKAFRERADDFLADVGKSRVSVVVKTDPPPMGTGIVSGESTRKGASLWVKNGEIDGLATRQKWISDPAKYGYLFPAP